MSKSPAIKAFKRAAARRLRHHESDAELKLWRELKRLEIRGSHFRRQMPIGDFIADFACPAAKLVIEVDGSQHGDTDNRIKDHERTRWLEAEGYRVLRFWNNDLTQNLDGVLETIYAALYGDRDSEARALKHRRRIRSP